MMNKLLLIGLMLTVPLVLALDPPNLNSTGQAPDTANCIRHEMCNRTLCAEVCQSGTVEIDTWALNALNFQRKLQRDLPLPYYQMPGTHNSYQTQSSGIGVEESGLHELFLEAKYKDNNVVLQNQRYSVTDQLRMGLRWMEFDMWGFIEQYEDIRLCHDPFPDPRLLTWVDLAEIKTRTKLKWDPENLGCFSTHNQNLQTGLQEVDTWLNLPENKEEIIVIYYDVKSPFIDSQVKEAVKTTLEVFGDRIFTPADKEILGRWPTAKELIVMGKQVIFECNSESFEHSDLIFYPRLTSDTYGGRQFSVDRFTPFPHCAIDGEQYHYGGGFFRPLDHSIAKGPALQPDPKQMIKPQDIRNFVDCGISTMGLDNVQPSAIAEMIWSWAPK